MNNDERMSKDDILKDVRKIISLMRKDVNDADKFLYQGGLENKMNKQFGHSLSKERRDEEKRIYAIINASSSSTSKWLSNLESLINRQSTINNRR